MPKLPFTFGNIFDTRAAINSVKLDMGKNPEVVRPRLTEEQKAAEIILKFVVTSPLPASTSSNFMQKFTTNKKIFEANDHIENFSKTIAENDGIIASLVSSATKNFTYDLLSEARVNVNNFKMAFPEPTLANLQRNPLILKEFYGYLAQYKEEGIVGVKNLPMKIMVNYAKIFPKEFSERISEALSHKEFFLSSTMVEIANSIEPSVLKLVGQVEEP